MGRNRGVAFSTSQHKTKGLFDIIHTDVWGTFASSIHRGCYVLCYIHRWFLQESLSILIEAEIENISEIQGVKNYGGDSEGRKEKVLRSDNEGKYTSTEFKAYLTGKGIKHQLSFPGRPEQNGVAERMN